MVVAVTVGGTVWKKLPVSLLLCEPDMPLSEKASLILGGPLQKRPVNLTPHPSSSHKGTSPLNAVGCGSDDFSCAYQF